MRFSTAAQAMCSGAATSTSNQTSSRPGAFAGQASNESGTGTIYLNDKTFWKKVPHSPMVSTSTVFKRY